MRNHRWAFEQLEEAVLLSKTVADVCRHLNVRGGGATATVKADIERYGINTSHFVPYTGRNRTLSEKKDTITVNLRKGVSRRFKTCQLIELGFKKAECEECGLIEWRGKPAPLQLDHADGDNQNNELSNLRILCANCHQQTETWGFKNGRRRPFNMPL
jgi:hypothetical protein